MPANRAVVLALLLVTSVLFAVGTWTVVRLSDRALHRLGIDPTAAALWLGLAEFAPEEVAAPRPRHRARRHPPTPPPRASAPSQGQRRPRAIVEWGEGADFAFATQAPARARQ